MLAYFAASRTADALHKALIEFACIAVNVLVHELLGRPRREVTVPKLLTCREATTLTQRRCWSNLYLLAVFRNRIVAHHDIPRMGGTLSEAGGRRRLAPLPNEFSMSTAGVTTLTAVKDRLRFIEAPANHFDLLDYLFRIVPVRFGEAQSRERRQVDSIVERGGVRSFSR